MSTAFPHCSLESKARAGRLNAPAVPGAVSQTLCHYGQSAPVVVPKTAADQRQETEMETSTTRRARIVSIRSLRCGAAKILAPLEPGVRSFLERSPPPPDARNRASPPPFLLRPS